MRHIAVQCLVIAAMIAASFISANAAQTIYAVVSPAPAPASGNAEPEVTTFPLSNEALAPTSYQAMFHANAFAVLDAAFAVESRTAKSSMTADEFSLFQAIRASHAANFSLAEAALIVSGVHDPAQRQKYLAQIDEITAGAEAVAAKQTNQGTKASAILHYLVAGPMNAGYDSNQYKLANLLDTARYNCVSSAILFTVVAQRLGLEAAAVEQPGHVFCRVPGYDVQTTCDEVYTVDRRMEWVRKVIDESKSGLDGFNADHPYHETGDLGLLLCMYQTIANGEKSEKKFDQSAFDDLKQACLDPAKPNTGTNVKCGFTDWFNASMINHDFVTARAIAGLYRQIARDPALAKEFDQCIANAAAQLAAR